MHIHANERIRSGTLIKVWIQLAARDRDRSLIPLGYDPLVRLSRAPDREIFEPSIIRRIVWNNSVITLRALAAGERSSYKIAVPR